MNRPSWLKGWKGAAIYTVGGLLVLFGAYSGFVSYSNGAAVKLNIEVGTNGDGTMYLRCGAGSTPSVCSPGDSVFHVAKRASVQVNVHNKDGGAHTHDIRLQGGPYWLWPAGFENELNQPDIDTSFTAYAAGTFEIVCEITGHYDAGMHATLIVA